MGRISLLFSGQGSQFVGMGSELVEKFPKLRYIFETGSEILGFDIEKAINTGTEQELSLTKISQPAIFGTSLIALEAFKTLEKAGYNAVCGHSLGEYAALVACGILDIENGFKAIKIRCEAMSRAAEKNPGGMAAVIGAEKTVIEEACAEILSRGDYITPVNYNSAQQTVIAGSSEGLQKATELLTSKGVRKIVKLNVSAAFHSELMREAGDEFKQKSSEIMFRKTALNNVDFYSNLLGCKLTDYENISDYLARHICSPVRFKDELNAMRNDGIDTFIEIGPGKVLSGLVKKTLNGVRTGNVEDLKSLETTGELLK